MRVFHHALAAFALFVVIVCQMSFVQAQQPFAVVISCTETTPMLRRLQQEIEALGFAVRIKHGGFDERPPTELSSPGTIAAIEVVTNIPGSIALYVLEPKTARVIRQELPIEAPHDPAATELVTTRAVELLRAARLEVSSPSKPPQAVQSHSSPVGAPSSDAAREGMAEQQSAPRATSAQLQLGAGPGTSYVPGWRASSNLGATIAYFNRHGVGWVGGISVTMIPAQIRVPGIATIEAYTATFRMGAAVQTPRQAPVALRLASGMEWNQLKFVGQTSPPYAGSSSLLSTLGPWIAFGAGMRFSPQFQLITQLSTSWATRRTSVRVDGQEAGTWGRPTLSASMTLEWRSL